MKLIKTELLRWRSYLALALFFTLVLLSEVFDWGTLVLAIGVIMVALVDLLISIRGKKQPINEVLRMKGFHLALVIVTVFLLSKFFPA